MPLTDSQIQDRVSYHTPSPDGVIRHKKLANAIAYAMTIFDEVVPDGREKSLAMTNLEQSKFWGSAGVARNPETV